MTQDKTIVLQIFNDLVAATLAQDKLKANAIASFLENEHPIGLNPLGGIELKYLIKIKRRRKKYC